MHTYTTKCLLLAATLSMGVLAAQERTAPRRGAVKAEAAQPAKAPGLTVAGVISLVQAGLSDDVIVTRLRKENRAFDLGPQDLIELKKARVSDLVLKVMIDPRVESAPSAPAVPASTPVVVSVPGLASSNPSGATPSPGTQTGGDLNDPLTPHDSGIYLQKKDRDGKALMIVLERAAYQGSKTSGTFLAGMTAGLKKAKMKAVVPGNRASIRTAEGTPFFYFYFDDKSAGLGKSYFGMSNVSNPNQFALLKLEASKSNRETIISEFGAFGASTGTHAKSMVAFKSERIRTGLYKVVPSEPLAPGEYCFLASSGALGAYGAGAATAADLFDFGIDPNE